MAMFLLDTTTLTHLRNGHPKAVANYHLHLTTNSRHSIAVASVNVEEVMMGWLSYLR
jgi:hypothetical protein